MPTIIRLIRTLTLTCLCFAVACLAGSAPCLAADEPQWIWSTPEAATKAPAGRVFFRKTIDVPALESAQLEIACDNVYALFINNDRVGAGIDWQELDAYDVTKSLRVGKNSIAILAENGGDSPAGLVIRLSLKPKTGEAISHHSGKAWKFSPREVPGWREVSFDDSAWQPAVALGTFGKTAPWGQIQRRERGSATPEFVRKERPAGIFQLVDGDRVVFLGDTLVERASRDDYWESILTARFPDRNITFRNLGWSGDTVGGDARAGFGTVEEGYQQLKSQVYFARPTVVFVGYGSASSFEGEAGLPKFEQGLNRLLDDLAVTKAEIVLLSPLRHEHQPKPLPDPAKHNRDLERYTAAIRTIAKSRGTHFVDLYADLISTSMVAPGTALTDNGIHLNAKGYLKFASEFESRIGWSLPQVDLVLTAGGKVTKDVGVTVGNIDANASGLNFTVSNSRLPTSSMGIGQPPRLTITELPEGNWVLSSGGKPLVTKTSGEWARGVELTNGPGFDRFETLRSTIREKNQLYFHRWRPQNETYLFGFRKNEQGQNGKEIPMFDPLVEKLEKQIADLRRPTEDVLELRRAK
ncbi:MAG: GDSL-type esterase/lipase family protein [Planctomycetota bacterium]|nr:GDSL-type esterase/lipase family protein [Planctomycetota bacterium]